MFAAQVHCRRGTRTKHAKRVLPAQRWYGMHMCAMIVTRDMMLHVPWQLTAAVLLVLALVASLNAMRLHRGCMPQGTLSSAWRTRASGEWMNDQKSAKAAGVCQAPFSVPCLALLTAAVSVLGARMQRKAMLYPGQQRLIPAPQTPPTLPLVPEAKQNMGRSHTNQLATSMPCLTHRETTSLHRRPTRRSNGLQPPPATDPQERSTSRKS